MTSPFPPSATAPAGTYPASDPLHLPEAAKSALALLIVDDDRTLREGCANILQLDGYNVQTIGRGDEAVDLLR